MTKECDDRVQEDEFLVFLLENIAHSHDSIDVKCPDSGGTHGKRFLFKQNRLFMPLCEPIIAIE